MNDSDRLRCRLPRLSAEMASAIEYFIDRIHREIELEQRRGPQIDAWKKGMNDALSLARPARDAQEQFRIWLGEVLTQEVDACGLTAEERQLIMGKRGDEPLREQEAA